MTKNSNDFQYWFNNLYGDRLITAEIDQLHLEYSIRRSNELTKIQEEISEQYKESIDLLNKQNRELTERVAEFDSQEKMWEVLQDAIKNHPMLAKEWESFMSKLRLCES